MESKLTALFALILFISLTLVGLLLKYAIGLDFSMRNYFQYLLLLVIAVLVLGRPLVKLGMDLVKVAYHGSDEHFPVPGSRLPTDDEQEKPGNNGPGTAKRGQGG